MRISCFLIPVIFVLTPFFLFIMQESSYLDKVVLIFPLRNGGER